MLKHATTKTINLPAGECAKCLLDPEGVLGASKYTYTVKRLDKDKYEVVFKWVKMGMTRFYKVRFTVKQEDNEITYQSTGDSDHWMNMQFTIEPAGDATRVKVTALMKAGLLASLLGKRDYAEFIEELVEAGIRRSLSKISDRAKKQATPGAQPLVGNRGVSCNDCLLYDPDRGYCYKMARKVEEGECKGRYYISKTIISREARS